MRHRQESEEDRHPGIRIDKISVKSRVGLVLTVGIIMMFLVTLPEVRWFFIVSIPPGLLVGLALYLYHRRRA